MENLKKELLVVEEKTSFFLDVKNATRNPLPVLFIYNEIVSLFRLVLVDKRILSGGIAMLVVGMVLLFSINSAVPIGKSGMTEEEILDLAVKEQENKDMNTLASILTGLGFLLVLISFGTRRKSKESPKKETKKPEV